MRRAGHRLFATVVASLLAVAACSRTGLLVPEPQPDASVDIDASSDASADVFVSCTPQTCAQQGFNCGANGDGCGNVIQCGTCTAPQSCGLGGFSRCGGIDAGVTCTPQTCTSLGLDCGPAADGCGGLLQCGTCQAPLVCGAAGTPGRCGATCTNLCAQQVHCDSGTTTVSGTVVAGTLPMFGAPDPIDNALVYVPNGTVEPFPAGVRCSQCGGEVSGDPLVETQTGPDGSFTLQNVPVGADIPLVIQLGRWRRQIEIPMVAPCTNTALAQEQTRLPRNQAEGDIPLTAIATGYADGVECVLIKMGVDIDEFTQPDQGGRIHLYLSNGVDDGPGTPPAESLWGSAATLANYDQVLLPCEGQPLFKSPSDQQNVIDYTNAGGRMFTTHYGYTWLVNDPPFSGTANFTTSTSGAGVSETGYIDTSSAKGQDLLTWLTVVGALSGPDQVSLVNTRYDVASVNPPSEQYIYATSPYQLTLQYGFYTPIGTPPTQQCGRVIFSDFHVVDQTESGATFPSECAMTPMNSQQKALEFMLFDLASCIPGPHGPCSPQTCADQGIDCGPAGDGCGNVIQCGTCPPGQLCGGGGYGVCGGPDAGTCVPETCNDLHHNCGIQGNGCGGTIDCGSCTPPAICGGGGQPSVCGT